MHGAVENSSRYYLKMPKLQEDYGVFTSLQNYLKPG